MAVGGYGYDPKGVPEYAAFGDRERLAKCGVSLDVDTIRK